MLAAVTPRAALRRAVDPRVFGGVIIMVGSAYAGLVAMGNGPEAVLVAVAARNLPAGIELQPDDFALQEVVVAQPERYLRSTGAAGALAVPVGEGELIPASAIAELEATKRLVALPIEAERLPPHVQRGSQVDVWGAAGDRPVLQNASVVTVADPEQWSGATATVVLAVAEDEVADLLAATRAGAVDITGYQGGS